MVRAYVQIGVERNQENLVYDKLKKLEEIKQADLVFGPWDIICLIEMDSVTALTNFVTDTIRKIPEVRMTSTLVVAK